MELNQPVPELPVSDVERAQEYYTRYFGCKAEWLYPGKEIGAVSNGETAIFLRKRESPFEPAVHWIYCSDVDDTYKKLKSSGANVVKDIEDKPWGVRQFTVHDLDGNIFIFITVNSNNRCVSSRLLKNSLLGEPRMAYTSIN